MEDSKIVQLYWNRDQSAIAHTAKKYGKYCAKIAKNILGNEEDAEECVNDTYMKAWNSMPDHRPEILSTFLGKITRNLSFNRYKHNHAEKRGGSEITIVLDELNECVSGSANIEQEIEYQELIMAINEFLATLSVDKRGMFVCRYWYADSISDIAKQYGIRENTVSMTLLRLRRKLEKYLKERGFDV